MSVYPVLLLGDLHLNEGSVETIVDIMDGIADIALERMTKPVVIQLGDVFSHKRAIPTKALGQFRDALERWWELDIESHWIAGNHDQPDLALSGHDALLSIEGMDGVHVYHKPAWTRWGLMVPHCYSTDAFSVAVNEAKPDHLDAPNVLYCHQGIRGAYRNNKVVDHDGIDASAVERFDHVFAGHYHRPQTIGNVVYVGTPWQTRADEIGQEKRVVLFRIGKELEWESIPVEFGARYFVVEWDCKGKPPPPPEDAGPQDHVRVELVADSSDIKSKRTRKALEKAGYGNAKVVGKATDERRLRLEVEDLSMVEVVDAYIERTVNDVDPEEVQRLLQKVAR